MPRIQFTLKLMDVTSRAADGSSIPRSSWEEYLTTDTYRQSIKDKTTFGGLSHKNRRLTPELKGLIGQDDYQLIDDNTLFYFTRIYFKSGDNFVYGDCETLDPELFVGKRAENIHNLIGFILSGVRFNSSIVIQALWDKTGVARKIIKLKGADLTQNPSFKGAGMETDYKVFSEVVPDLELTPSDEKSIKEFSDLNPSEDLELRTVVYSVDCGIMPISEDGSVERSATNPNEPLFGKIISSKKSIPNAVFSFNEIVACYGMSSPQVKVIMPYQGKQLTAEELNSLSDKDQTNKDDEITDDPNLTSWYNKLINMAQDGDRDKLQYIFKSNRDKLTNIINSVPESDPNRDAMIQARLVQYFRTIPEGVKLVIFSDVSNVAVRARNQEQPRYTKIHRIIQSYKQYNQGQKLTEEKKLKVKLLFLQDINLLIKEVLPDILKGKTLNSLYALSRYGKDVKDSSIQLSTTYRKVLIADKIMQFIPKALYGEWIIDIRKFYQSLCIYVFGEELTELQLNLIDIK